MRYSFFKYYAAHLERCHTSEDSHEKDFFLIIILKGNTEIGFYGGSQNLQRGRQDPLAVKVWLSSADWRRGKSMAYLPSLK